MRKHLPILLALLSTTPSNARISLDSLPEFHKSLPRGLFKGGFGAFGGKAGGHDGCEVLEETNRQRRRRNRRTLRANKRLDASAMIVCQNMAYYDDFGHTAGGSTPGQRAQSAGYDWNAVAENIYYDSGYGPPDPARYVRTRLFNVF
jgi:uncharacterized protein YkwD